MFKYLTLLPVAFGYYRRNSVKRSYEMDRYNHKNVNGWNAWYRAWGGYGDSKIANSEDDATNYNNIRDVLADPSFVILDLRRDEEIENHDLKDEAYLDEIDADLNAHYSRFVYNDVKVAPEKLIYAVAEPFYESIQNLGELSEEEIFDKIGQDFEEDKTIEDPELRDANILLLCNSEGCGCRYSFATWHGFNQVKTLMFANKYLKGMEEEVDA